MRRSSTALRSHGSSNRRAGSSKPDEPVRTKASVEPRDTKKDSKPAREPVTKRPSLALESGDRTPFVHTAWTNRRTMSATSSTGAAHIACTPLEVTESTIHRGSGAPAKYTPSIAPLGRVSSSRTHTWAMTCRGAVAIALTRSTRSCGYTRSRAEPRSTSPRTASDRTPRTPAAMTARSSEATVSRPYGHPVSAAAARATTSSSVSRTSTRLPNLVVASHATPLPRRVPSRHEVVDDVT